MRQKWKQGQAIVEYLLLVLMVSITIAVTIRNTNRTIYNIWTALVRQVALPSSEANGKAAPGF